MKSIDRYMARLIAVPLISMLLITAMLLVLDRMLRLIEFVANEGGPVSVVWRMLANLLPEYLGLGIPIGLLLGVLLAFRRLATTSELDVLRAVGLGYGRMLFVPYLYCVVLAALNLAIVGYIQPRARYNYEGLRFELRTGALGASIKVGEFTRFGPRMTLRVEQSRNNGRDLSGIFVHMVPKSGGWIAATAEKGRFLATDDPDTIILRLTKGTLVHEGKGFVSPRTLSFTSHDLPIPLPKYEAFRQRGDNAGIELTLPELVVQGRPQNADANMRAKSRAALHYRLAEVAIMFLLPLLGIALGIPPKRSTSALGVFVAVVMLVTYHKINEYGQSVGGLGKINPILALWGPWVLFAALILWMYYVIAYVPGGQPIGALERAFGKVTKFIVRHLPGRRNRPDALAGAAE
jgi:lipopolysaccharide export system permease protein